MKLDFVIYWIDNQLEDIQGTVDSITRTLTRRRFQPRIISDQDGSRIRELSQTQVGTHEIDLVLIDWDMGRGRTRGSELALEVRTRFGFTDIILYSGKTTDTLRQEICEYQVDGVYCMHRDNLKDSVNDRIDEVVKGLERLSSIRGLTSSVLADCDMIMREYILRHEATCDENAKAELFSSARHLVEASSNRVATKLLECTDLGDLNEQGLLTSFHLWRLTRAIIKTDGSDQDLVKANASFKEDVISPRNLLGHEPETPGEDWVVTNGKQRLRRSDVKELRGKLSVHYETLEKLALDRFG